MDTDGKIMIGRQQPRAFGDDSVAVVVRVAGKGDIEFIFEGDQRLHGIRRRRIHADPSIPVERHKRESRIDDLVDDLKIQPIALSDGLPIVNTRAAEWIDSERDARIADDFHIQNVSEVLDISRAVVVLVRCGRDPGFVKGQTPDPVKSRSPAAGWPRTESTRLFLRRRDRHAAGCI